MDHAYIEEQRIADRYLAHDLTPGEARAFERHFADCPECLDRIALAEIFRQRLNGASTAEAASTPEPTQPAVSLSTPEPEPRIQPAAPQPFGMLLLDRPPPPPETESRVAAFFGQFSGWQLASLAALAGILLLAVPSLFFLAHSREMRRQVVSIRSVPRAPSLHLKRGEPATLVLDPDLAFIVLLPSIGIPGGSDARIRASLAGPTGRVVWTALFPNSPGGPAIAVPAEALEPGDHILLLHALAPQGDSSDLGTFPFRVQSRR